MYNLSTKVAISKSTKSKKMSIGALFDFIGDCEQCQIDSESYLSDFLTTNNMGMFLTSRYAQIVNMPKYGQTVRACTSIYDLQSYYGYRNTFVYDQDDNILVKSYTMGVLVDLDKNKITKAPDEFAKGYKTHPKLDMYYAPRKIECVGDAVCCPPVVVKKSFIDIYGHTNNVKYIACASDCLDEIDSLQSVRVEFKNASKLGDTMSTKKYTDQNKTTIEFCNDNLVYAIVEFEKV